MDNRIFQEMKIVAFPLIRLADRSTPSPVLGEGFYSYALCKKLGCSIQLSHSAMSDFCTQLCPRGTLIADQRGHAQHGQRGKMKNRPVGVYSEPNDSSFSLPRGARRQVVKVTPNLIQLTFTSQTGSLLLSSLKKVTFSPSFLRPLLTPFLPSRIRGCRCPAFRPAPDRPASWSPGTAR